MSASGSLCNWPSIRLTKSFFDTAPILIPKSDVSSNEIRNITKVISGELEVQC